MNNSVAPTRVRMTDSRYLIRKFLFSSIASLTPSSDELDIILDVGCGEVPYRSLFGKSMYIGMDRYSKKSANVIASAEFLPLKSGCLNIIICTQTLMYLKSVRNSLREFNRVLANNGHVLLSAHGVWSEKHEPGSIDLWRWTLDGLIEILKTSEFEIKGYRSMNSYLSLVQLLILYSPSKLVIFPLNILGKLLDKLFRNRKGPRIHLIHSVLAKKTNNQKSY